MEIQKMNKILLAAILSASASTSMAAGIDFTEADGTYVGIEAVSSTPGFGYRAEIGAGIGTIALKDGSKIRLMAELAYSSINVSVPTQLALGGSTLRQQN
jgi:hypothetical protein